MSEKQSLYTKYRPQNFEQVVGQNIAKNILKNSILENKINHAYLFYGIRGTGKTTLARIFAKAVNCENRIDANPCNQCESCKTITNGSSYDVIEIDAASNNGVDEIRSIKENTNYLTTNSKYKVYIIDEVHMLTKQAFNALLKTLEEPPMNTIFLLATTELQKIPQTVLSRNIIINLEVMSNNDIKTGLKNVLNNEKINYDENALDYIIMVAGGSLRDAISALETTLLYNKELNVENVINSLGLIKREEIEIGLKNNKLNLIDSIDKSDKDIQKLILLITDVLMELIKFGEHKYSELLNSIIDLAVKVRDPLLLKIGLKSAILTFDVSRETTLISNVVENSNLIEEKTLIGENLKEKNVEEYYEENLISLRNNENLEQINEEKNVLQEEEKIEKLSIENVDNYLNIDENSLKVITDYVDGNVYLFVVKHNDQMLMSKISQNWRFLDNYITSEYKDEVAALIKTTPLASTNKTLIVGFSNEEQIKEFKRISLTKGMMAFIKEIIGEHKFILPINGKNWSQLLAIKDKIPMNQLHDINLNLDDYKFDKTDLIEQEIESLFD